MPDKTTHADPLHIDSPSYQGPERRLEMREWRAHVDARLDDGAATMKHLRSEITENTTATKEVRSDTSELVTLFHSVKGAFWVLEKIGKLAKPLGYIVILTSAVLALVAGVKGGPR
jgi:hypothetical protein